MRISIAAAGLFTVLGGVALTSPAAAVPADLNRAIAAPADILTPARLRHHYRGGPSRRVGSMRHQQYRFNKVTRGAPAGDSGGNAVTGSGAAPSGKN